MATLRVLNGSLEGQEIELIPDPQTVGRGSSCNVKIGDAGVSSKHAKVWCEDGVFFVMDLGSTNGTFVNDRDVDREQLSDGDTVTFGMTKAQFVADQLVAEGIPATLQNSFTSDGVAAAVMRYPHLVVVRAADLPRARTRIEEFELRKQARQEHKG